MNQPTLTKPRPVATISWILYDLANTAYSMNVVSMYFGTWIIINLQQSDFIVSFANSFSMILVALTLPVLGHWSDIRGGKMVLLAVMTGVCIGCTALLGIVGVHIDKISVLIPLVMVLFVVANYSYQGGLVFYNALLPAVSTPRTIGRVSGYGVAVGYMGSILGLAVAGVFVEGSFYGLQIPGISAGGTTAAFIPTAAVFLLFAVPIFLWVKEPPSPLLRRESWRIRDSYRKTFRALTDSKNYPGLPRFLLAKLLYEDSIETVIIYMGVYTQAVMQFTRAEANQFFIVVVPSAIIGSALCGILTDHFGPKKTLTGVIFLWVAALMCLVLTSNRYLFWGYGCVLGMLMGSVWTSARPLLISLAPKERLGEFFGLYALSGKIAAVLGPLIWSVVTYLLASYGNAVRYKAAIAVLAVNMLIGALILRGVPDKHRKK
ncbi:MFS transporter [candidate division KSB1 bacterium]|nr:MFS transporter [candidate division KSB1 bacterium]